MEKGKLLCLTFVEGVNQRGHRIIGNTIIDTKKIKYPYQGFLDLKDRSHDVGSQLDLHSYWLVPGKDDLTFVNLATNNAQTTTTKVRTELTGLYLKEISQDFQVSVSSGGLPTVDLVFHLEQLDAFIKPTPISATLFGNSAKSLEVEFVSEIKDFNKNLAQTSLKILKTQPKATCVVTQQWCNCNPTLRKLSSIRKQSNPCIANPTH